MQNGLKLMFFMKGKECLAYFFISEHSASLSLFQKKNLFGNGQGVCPLPPFTDWSVIYSFY